ncbi:winged helix-turn-helix transcriptional regulator [Candidatus Woesearchaeota archaeon]|jgi:DNA-binding transcriptional ArsR family regulator|nr:winged helix-turn-helix transcriptional regulator [Candidatus Woesearchaeota archaeon]MBT5397042.1 winged helix-turn-helix transcriptional regulator [Candidatus Woesearchaeota archaeon]MBT5924562.1 winged helix-turn-helix transcriptional regulator [Candidatus Woesearchaeota archaeon]MBT6367412.1 winged helix-turn-helix transcriptional regulator [Candidatus Woesearchaeota archaeon]MBT7762442.1 winged helix-turn-helix transcriptional regulator [Candidatus Woesearchaeota archaeon]
MTNKSYNSAYELFFGSLSNPNRLEIINTLRTKSMCVTEVCEKTGFEQTMVSHNLKRLEKCGMVFVEQKGKHRYYSVNKKTITPLLSLIDAHMKKYCCKIVGGTQ